MLLLGVEMPQQPETELCASCIQGLFSWAPLPALSSGRGKGAAPHCFSPFFLHLEDPQSLSHSPAGPRDGRMQVPRQAWLTHRTLCLGSSSLGSIPSTVGWWLDH